ncbi:protein N-terminal glutamine amidohydrolase-like protein [Aphelenchoides avenae]|nr:protein N-terminal glutamine amidohydrolase-like protein [Aphelenchus avenae]
MGLDKLGVPSTSDCLYAACYCEENIWQLCKSIKCDDDSRLQPFYVVFISNDEKKDYHVILLRHADSKSQRSLVYDLDTTLPFPCTFEEYFEKAIGSEESFAPMFKR